MKHNFFQNVNLLTPGQPEPEVQGSETGPGGGCGGQDQPHLPSERATPTSQSDHHAAVATGTF